MKAIGFDFDGTIIDIEKQKSRAFGIILNKYWGVNAERAAKYWIDTAGKSRRSKFDYFFREKYKKELADKEYKKIERVFSNKLKNDFYPKVKFIEGALELLKFCRSNFDVVFCSSGVPEKELKYLVKLTKADKYFDRIYGSSNKYKSKEDHFKEILNEFKPGLIVFVGDGFEDMWVGRKYGAITIGVTSHQSKKKLIQAGANYTSSTKEVIKILKSKLNLAN